MPGIVSSVAANAGVSALSGAARASAPPAVDGMSFGQLLDQLSTGLVDSLKSGEAAAIAGVEGKASTQQVVDTIMSAERTLQTAVAVRDRAVSAYQEISRMAI
ncbi:MAG: flagellar hook-basal body protein FliE [Methylocystaceae bacterium]|nr:MAG: flagellar hook-basal body protein FliE [Methylocystaceae bacterium]